MNWHFPSCFVLLPEQPRRAAFYLAAEEWIAHHLPADNYLFTWQVSPTVVMGRNQIAHQEVDIDFCRQHGIDLIRRKSGGGAIFADNGNIMISLITPGGKVEPLFTEYAATVAGGLRSLGAHVEVHGRNDIILMGKGKVCGNAFYHLSSRNIVHGTLLYTTDYALMMGALKPLPDKLHPKGVQSVRARVGVLSEAVLNLPGEGGVLALKEELRRILTNRTLVLPPEAIQEIETLEQAYYDEGYLYGSSAKDEEVRGCRVDGCGRVELHFELKGSLIKSVRLAGDFFELSPAEPAFQNALVGLKFTPECLAEAIRKYHPETTIRNLSEKALLQELTKQP